MVPRRRSPRVPVARLAAALALLVAGRPADAGAQRGAAPPRAGGAREPGPLVAAPPITVVAPPRDSLAVLGRWSVRNGLPQQSVTELVEDRDGFLWGATYGGLIRFDGDRIETFALDRLPVLQGNRVTAIAAARDGGVWVGTPTGEVVLVRNGTEVRRLPPVPGAERFVESLLEAPDGSLWAWAGWQLAHWRSGAWRVVVPRIGVGMHIAIPLVPVPRGDTLYTGAALGVLRVTGDTATPLHPGDTTLHGAWRMVRDGARRLWVGTRHGLYVVAPPYGTTRPARVLPADVRALAVDAAGDVWVAAIDTIWRVRAPPGAAPVVSVMSLEPARHISLAPTRDGVLVAGAMGDGLLTFVPRVLRPYRLRRGTELLEGTNVLADGAGGLLVSSMCLGTYAIDVVRARATPLALAGSPGCVVAMARDPAGGRWVSSLDRLVHVAPGGAPRTVGDPRRVRDLRPIVAVARDTVVGAARDGALWRIAADGGRAPVRGWRAPGGELTALVRAADGTLWAGGRGTVWRIAPGGAVTRWDTAQGIPRGPVRHVHVARDGRTWVGSYGGGLALLAAGATRWRHVPLADATVIAITEDARGTLWLSQNRGLTVLRREAIARWLADTASATPSEPLAALPDATEGSNGAPSLATLPTGHIAVATVEGLVVADPTRLPRPAPAPRLVVLALRAGRDTLAVGDSVALPLGARTLDVRVAAPSYRAPDELRFRYRLEGRDAAWLDLGARRQFLLTDLPTGRFALRVQLTGPDGTTSESARMTLRVPPYWYETPWAALTAFGALALLLGVYMRQRTGVLAARNAALQAQLDARRMAAETTERHRRELAQVGRVAVAGEMTAALMHELGQPLTAIVNNAEVARRLLHARRDGAAIEEALDDIATQGARAAQVVTSLRRFLRRGVGVSEPIDVAELVAEVSALVRQEYADAHVAFEGRVAPGTPAVRGERVLLQQVLVNLLTNACDAVRGRGEARVRLRARAAGRGVRISVIDNGPGIAPPLRAAVFDPFVSGKESGMGMGLAIARRIVEGHGGAIALGAARGGGAVFSVRLPGPGERLHD